MSQFPQRYSFECEIFVFWTKHCGSILDKSSKLKLKGVDVGITAEDVLVRLGRFKLVEGCDIGVRSKR